MAKYQIEWGELKPTSTGKQRFLATLKDEQGVVTDNVTLWGDFPDFATLAPGREVNGKISEKQNGQYLNRTLYPETTYKTFTAKPSGIAKAQETKRNDIAVAQDNKAESIKISSTFRDATLITISMFGDREADEVWFKQEWANWRQWLWQNYDASDRDFPPLP